MNINNDPAPPTKRRKLAKPADAPVRDLKSYLSCLERNGLVGLAGKYKIKICKSGRKQEMINTFVNRVPSDMIGIICDDLEQQRLVLMQQKVLQKSTLTL